MSASDLAWLRGIVASVPRGWSAATPRAQAAANIIAEEFDRAGVPPGITLAALVNAYAESKWNPDASGDDGWSIGLFQLNRKSGAGRGMSEAQARDPRANTRQILKEVNTYGGALRSAFAAGATVAELAAIYSRDIERPRRRDYEMARRRALASDLFGAGIAHQRANGIGGSGWFPAPQAAPLVPLDASPMALAQLRPEAWIAALATTTIGLWILVRATRRG